MKEITLINGETISEMEKLPDESIDVILVDPPYGTMKGLNFSDFRSGKKINENHSWDTKLDSQELFNQYQRLLKVNGRLIMFSMGEYTVELRNIKHPSLKFQHSLYWNKQHYANFLTVKKAPASVIEEISVFQKEYGSFTKSREYSKGILDYLKVTKSDINKKLGNRKAEHFFRHDTRQFSLLSKEVYEALVEAFKLENMTNYKTYDEVKALYQSETRQKVFNLPENQKHFKNILEYKRDKPSVHPTQKPIKLLEEIIKVYSNQGELILDNTMGSGSTGVASIKQHRRFIGIELDKNYFEIAKERIESESNNKKRMKAKK